MDMAVLEAISRAVPGERMVLATIVRTWGSTPRKSGAQMLVYPDGRIVGTIGGGCGEAEVRQQALGALDRGRPEIYRLDLTREVAEDEGMVCGGIMEVFLEPID